MPRAPLSLAKMRYDATTASGSLKPAVTDTGITVMVPAFVLTGDKIKVSTDSGEYMERG